MELPLDGTFCVDLQLGLKKSLGCLDNYTSSQEWETIINLLETFEKRSTFTMIRFVEK